MCPYTKRQSTNFPLRCGRERKRVGHREGTRREREREKGPREGTKRYAEGRKGRSMKEGKRKKHTHKEHEAK